MFALRGAECVLRVPEFGILNQDVLAGMVLGAAVLAKHSADNAFRCYVMLLEVHNCTALGSGLSGQPWKRAV